MAERKRRRRRRDQTGLVKRGSDFPSLGTHGPQAEAQFCNPVANVIIEAKKFGCCPRCTRQILPLRRINGVVKRGDMIYSHQGIWYHVGCDPLMDRGPLPGRATVVPPQEIGPAGAIPLPGAPERHVPQLPYSPPVQQISYAPAAPAAPTYPPYPPYPPQAPINVVVEREGRESGGKFGPGHHPGRRRGDVLRRATRPVGKTPVEGTPLSRTPAHGTKLPGKDVPEIGGTLPPSTVETRKKDLLKSILPSPAKSADEVARRIDMLNQAVSVGESAIQRDISEFPCGHCGEDVLEPGESYLLCRRCKNLNKTIDGSQPHQIRKANGSMGPVTCKYHVTCQRDWAEDQRDADLFGVCPVCQQQLEVKTFMPDELREEDDFHEEHRERMEDRRHERLDELEGGGE